MERTPMLFRLRLAGFDSAVNPIQQGVQFFDELIEFSRLLLLLNLIAKPVHALLFLRSHHGA